MINDSPIGELFNPKIDESPMNWPYNVLAPCPEARKKLETIINDPLTNR